MSYIDPTSFWTQLIAGFLAGVLVLLVQPQWTRRCGSTPDRTEAAPRAAPMLLSMSDVEVHASINQSVSVDNSSTRITNAYPSDTTARGGDDGELVLKVMGGFLGTLLCLLLLPVLRFVSIGASVGVVVMLIAAVLRSRRGQVPWIKSCTVACVRVAIMLATVMVGWIGLSSTTRQGITTSALAGEAPQGLRIWEGLSWMFSRIWSEGALGVVFATLAVSVILVMFGSIITTWLTVVRWHAFLRLSIAGVSDSERGERRALVFQEMTPVGGVISSVVFGVIAGLAAYGIVFDLVTALISANGV